MLKNILKKLIYGFAVLAIAAVGVFHVSLNSKVSGASDVSLEYIQALARTEISSVDAKRTIYCNINGPGALCQKECDYCHVIWKSANHFPGEGVGISGPCVEPCTVVHTYGD